MFGKIINGNLTYPPHMIVLDGMQIFNPAEDQLISAGYKEIQEVPMPEDAPEGQHYEARYEDAGEHITQIWELMENDTVPEGKTIEQRVTTLEQDVSGINAAIERGLTT